MKQLGVIMPGLAWAVLAFISCSWTANSLYIWGVFTLPIAWIVALLLYVLASICFSKAMKALDRPCNVTQLFLGVAGLLACWIFFSLPTNTHYLVYKSAVGQVATDDVNTTRKYLSRINNYLENTCVKETRAKFARYRTEIKNLWEQMWFEYDDKTKPYNGPRFEEYLKKLDSKFSNALDAGVNFNRIGNSSQRDVVWNHYKPQYDTFMADLNKKEEEEINKCIPGDIDYGKINQQINNLDETLPYLTSDNIDDETIDYINRILHDAYSTVKTNQKEIVFDNNNERDQYSPNKITTKVDALKSPNTVWAEYFTSEKYDEHSFVWKIMLSLLIDIAAFVFFNIALNNYDEQE